MDELPEDWARALLPRLPDGHLDRLRAFVEDAREAGTIFPPAEDVFAAYRLTPFEDVEVLILGQDPYHGAGQAHGLAFSVRRGVKIPPSLRNMFKAREADLGIPPAEHGDLTAWAERGVLLLNTVLTVPEGNAHGHKGRGWEAVTDATIDALSARPRPLVFVLWGGPARKKARRIDATRHRIVERAHPSPLSAHRGFLGTGPFAAIDAALKDLGQKPLDWST